MSAGLYSMTCACGVGGCATVTRPGMGVCLMTYTFERMKRGGCAGSKGRLHAGQRGQVLHAEGVGCSFGAAAVRRSHQSKRCPSFLITTADTACTSSQGSPWHHCTHARGTPQPGCSLCRCPPRCAAAAVHRPARSHTSTHIVELDALHVDLALHPLGHPVAKVGAGDQAHKGAFFLPPDISHLHHAQL